MVQERLGRTSVAVSVAMMLTVTACSDPPSAVNHAALHANSASASASAGHQAGIASIGLLKEVHNATARFNSKSQASKAGYAIASPCIEHPTLGGMGFHWVNGSIVDPVFDPMHPEALVYAPDAQGHTKLAALEYIVIDVGQGAPTFAGQPFDVGGTPVPVPHWSLHVWIHLDNPSGTFSPWNPRVSCTT